MRDITDKVDIERHAVAEGFLATGPAARAAAANGVEKGDLSTLARVVGFAWAKHLPLLLPDAHPVRLTAGEVQVLPEPRGFRVRAQCTGVDRTGVELEALAMCFGGLMAVWDALKPHLKDKQGQYPDVAISELRVVSKRKGAAGHAGETAGVPAAVVVATDTRRHSGDTTGPALAQILSGLGCPAIRLGRVADEVPALRAEIEAAVRAGARLVIVAGGTGPSPRDVTPQALADLGGVELPGFGEAFREWSRSHDGVHGMLSRAACRLASIGDHRVMLVGIPGHPSALRALEPLLPGLLHASRLWGGGP